MQQFAFIADSATALAGMRFGKHKITQDRSLEGVIAGFVAAFLSAVIFVVPVVAALAVAAAIEVADVIVDGHASDNVIFPNHSWTHSLPRSLKSSESNSLF